MEQQSGIGLKDDLKPVLTGFSRLCTGVVSRVGADPYLLK
jgi:hypothetical protein